MSPSERTVAASCCSSILPSAVWNSRSPCTPASSTRLTFRELEPAFRTSTRNSLVRPGPASYVGRILPVVARVLAVADLLIHHQLTYVRCLGPERRHAVDDVHHEVKPVEVVEHDHVE